MILDRHSMPDALIAEFKLDILAQANLQFVDKSIPPQLQLPPQLPQLLQSPQLPQLPQLPRLLLSQLLLLCQRLLLEIWFKLEKLILTQITFLLPFKPIQHLLSPTQLRCKTLSNQVLELEPSQQSIARSVRLLTLIFSIVFSFIHQEFPTGVSQLDSLSTIKERAEK